MDFIKHKPTTCILNGGGLGGMDLWQASDDAFYGVTPASLGRVKTSFR